MATEASVGLESHGNYVLLLDQKPSTTEMTQINGLVVVECSGEYSLLVLNRGFWVSRYVIAGMQMETAVNVEEELQVYCVLPLENLLKNTEMTQIKEVAVAECHGSCLFLTIHPSGWGMWSYALIGIQMVMVGNVAVVLTENFVPLQTHGHNIIEMIRITEVEDVVCPGACTSDYVDISFVIDTAGLFIRALWCSVYHISFN